MKVFPAAIAVVGALAGIALALLFIPGPDDIPETGVASAGGSVTEVTGLLGTSNRANLSLCVDGAGGFTLSAQDVANVRRALADGLTSVRDRFPGAAKYREGAEVSEGCPPATAALTAAELADREADGTAKAGDIPGNPIRIPGTGDTPSSHVLYVYIVPEDVYERTFATAGPWAKGAAEMLCFGHACAQVTTALYVPPRIDAARLMEGVLSSIGLGPPLVDPPISPEEQNERMRQALERAGLSPAEIDDWFESACETVASACPTPP